MTEPGPGQERQERRRRRPAVSCILCRRRKIRCNREMPCSNCAKSKTATCVYRDATPRQLQGPFVGDPPAALGNTNNGTPLTLPLTPSASSSSTVPSHPSRPTRTATASSTAVSTIGDHSPRSLCHGGPAQNQTPATQAEKPVTQPSIRGEPISTFTKNSRVETTTIDFAGKFYFHSEQRLPGQPQAVHRSVTHKTRLFGQSHWVNAVALLPDLFMVLERIMRDRQSTACTIEQRCKALGRIIKARRVPPWPCPPTPELPARAIADALIGRYLSTSESILRVLHIPTFMREYEAVWEFSSNPAPSFLVQLKLVLAIGASTYDSAFSLRASAIRWVYEGQTWLSAPEFKHHLGIPALQTSVLLLLAREATGTGEDMVWASVGTTLRMAMYMGLHRDPGGLGPKNKTPLGAEMRRRLWNTILELVIQSSLDSGGPPLIGLADFDTEPPGNLDDEELSSEPGGQCPTPRPEDQFTQTTIAIALRKTFAQRLAIVKYLNDLASCGTYAETLKHDAELRTASKTMSLILQASKSSSSSTGPSDFSLRAVDLMVRRYFLCLHLPFFAPALQDATFAYSRKVVVESAVRLWRAVFPAPSSHSVPPTPNNDAADSSDTSVSDLLGRRAIFGSGLLRTAAVQGFVAIAVELKTLLREEEEGLGALGPIDVRPDLLLAMRDFKLWAWRGLEAGETNTKGYLVACMIAAQVEGLRRGLGEEGTVQLVMDAAEESVEKCLALLEGVVAQGDGQGAAMADDGQCMDGLGSVPELMMEDWDYMATSTALFDSGGVEFSSWFSDAVF